MTRTLKTRQALLGTSGEATGKAFSAGPGEVIGLTVDYGASADSGTVFTLYDGTSTAGVSMYAITGNTDIGTTVPARVFQNARLISGTATNNVHAGLPFFNGLFANVTLDVAGPQSVRVWYRPLVRKVVSFTPTGTAASAAGSEVLWQGAGRFVAARVVHDQLAGANTTEDITFYDGITTSGRALTAVANSIGDWVTSANMAVSTTTGHDEGGNAVTTAANAHENDGVLFYTGLTVGVAQSDPQKITVEVLVEG